MNIHIILVNQSLLSHHDWIPGHGWIWYLKITHDIMCIYYIHVIDYVGKPSERFLPPDPECSEEEEGKGAAWWEMPQLLLTESGFETPGLAITKPKTDPFVWTEEFDLDMHVEELSSGRVTDLKRDMHDLIRNPQHVVGIWKLSNDLCLTDRGRIMYLNGTIVHVVRSPSKCLTIGSTFHCLEPDDSWST